MTLRIAKPDDSYGKGRMALENPVHISNGLDPPDPEPEVVGIPGLVREMIGRFSCHDFVGVTNGYSQSRCSPNKSKSVTPSSTKSVTSPLISPHENFTARQSGHSIDHTTVNSFSEPNDSQIRPSSRSKDTVDVQSSSKEPLDVSLDTARPTSSPIHQNTQGRLNSNQTRKQFCEVETESDKVPMTVLENSGVKYTNRVTMCLSPAPKLASSEDHINSIKSGEKVIPEMHKTIDLSHNHVPNNSTGDKQEEETKIKECSDNNGEAKNPTVKDGNYYLKVMSQVESEVMNQCTQLEKFLSEPIPDEACGQIRAAIGKANLLVTKKFKQFGELCHQNLTQSAEEQFQTTNEDLTGFWDLVQLQVDDIQQHFQEIYELQAKNWVHPATDAEMHPITPSSLKVTEGRRGAQTVTPTPKKTRPTRTSDAAKAREEARKRLMAAKIAGRQRKASETDEDIQIFIS